MAAVKKDTKIRQEEIAVAALNLIATHGLKRLSVARVARQVGVVPSAIYRHYESKEDIIDAILDQIGGKLQGLVDGVCVETPDPIARLHRLLTRHVQLIRENRGIPRVVFSEDIYSGRPERKQKVYQGIRAYLRRVEEIIEQGQKEGAIRRGLKPEVLSVMFLGQIQPAAILWHMSDGMFDITKHAEKAWEIFSEAISTQNQMGSNQ